MSQPQPSDRPPVAARAALRRMTDVEEHFAPQRTSTESLPDPEPLLTALTRGVLEVLAGVREVDQLARWMTEDAYRVLVVRANLATRARSARGLRPKRPTPDRPQASGGAAPGMSRAVACNLWRPGAFGATARVHADGSSEVTETIV